jgi:hypothetical protein
LAASGFVSAFGQFPGFGSGWGYPWVVSLIYAVTDRSALLMQSLSVMAGVASCYLGYRLAESIWDKQAAIKTAWIVALFPTLAMYSALTMREAFISCATLFALLHIVRWRISHRNKSLFLGVLGFIFAGFFHGAMLVGGLVIAALVAAAAFSDSLRSLLKGRIKPIALILLATSAVAVYGSLADWWSIPYISFSNRPASLEAAISHSAISARGTAAYPTWLMTQDHLFYIAMMPIRVIYFLGAPFVWDITLYSHLIGLLDALLYLALVALLILNFRTIWTVPEARVVLMIIIPLIIVHALGTGNFGTGLRHRSKFVAVLVALSSPFLPNIRLKHPSNIKPLNSASQVS